MEKTLIYGYGNVGRKDDGLGVLCAQELEKWANSEGLDWIDVETNYQLNIEDAETISNYDQVYFLDASLEAIEENTLTEVEPDQNIIEFSMHAISPAYVLKLCGDMFGKNPKVFLLHIKGLDWDFVEGLSKQGARNLTKAVNKMKGQLTQVSQCN